MINDKLFNLYKSYTQGLNDLYTNLSVNGVEDYAGPHLPYCWEEQYFKSKHRLVIFGQETNGWYSDYMKSDEDIRKNIQVYKDFQLGANYNSNFWRYAHRINLKLNGFEELNFIWMNVNKFGRDSAKGKPDKIVLDNEVKYYNLLADELAILQPEVCIFFTGPFYDQDIKNKLSDLNFQEFCDFNQRKLARLTSKHLPKHSYRTYHPGYGNRIKMRYEKMLDAIIEDVRSEKKLWENT